MPKIKHVILSWARKTSNLSIEDAAHKLKLADSKDISAAEKLAAFENGTKEPSRSLLNRMSKLYHRPLLTFYLDKPPGIGDRGEDFRTLPEGFEGLENAYVDVLIRDIKARQNTIRETLIDERVWSGLLILFDKQLISTSKSIEINLAIKMRLSYCADK